MAKADDDLTRDRFGHSDPYDSGADLTFSRITYMCHAKGYVMARRPGCTPFVVSEKVWRAFAIYVQPAPLVRRTISG